jgi:hypothetical protein
MKRTILAVVGVAFGLFGMGFGVAEATSSIAPGTIHGCVAGPARSLERVYTNPNKGTTCPSGEFQVIWNQKGPAGPQGPAGPSTAGPAGLDVIVVTGQNQNGGQIMVPCPADHPYLIGGGGSAASNLVSSAPAGNEWVLESSYGATGQGNPGVEAEAICAK